MEINRTLYNNFIDFKQTFDSVWQEGLWRALRHCGVPEEVLVLTEDIYRKLIKCRKGRTPSDGLV